MGNKKLIPIVTAGVILTIIVITLFLNLLHSLSPYSILIVTYQSQSQSFENINKDNVYVIDSLTFWITKKDRNYLSFETSGKIIENNKETNKFKVKLNEQKRICFKDNTCAYLKIS